MKINNLAELIGKLVVCVADHGTLGYLEVDKYLKARRLGFVGTVGGWVPGHCGDVVWVTNRDNPEEDAVFCHYSGELEFYSDAAFAFALNKKVKIDRMEKELDDAKKAPFSEQVTRTQSSRVR